MSAKNRSQKVVKAGQLRKFAIDVLTTLGVPDDHAAITADALVEADLRGVHTHGMTYLPIYARRIMAGGINPKPQVRLLSDTPTTALLDGDNGLGQVVSLQAMKLGIGKAQKNGVGLVGVKNSNHFGAAACYSMAAAREGMIGFAMSNIGPTMAPWGGTTPCYGNNPISYAVPAPETPIVLDMATSVVALGKIIAAAATGDSIPPDWACDKKGHPTRDPNAALEGLLLPVGGHKGYGFALLIDILSGVLTGGAFGQEVNNLKPYNESGRVGHFFAAINVSNFIPLELFEERIAQMARALKSSELAEGVTRIYVPGELEYEKMKASGQWISLSDDVWQALNALAAELGTIPVLQSTFETP